MRYIIDSMYEPPLSKGGKVPGDLAFGRDSLSTERVFGLLSVRAEESRKERRERKERR